MHFSYLQKSKDAMMMMMMMMDAYNRIALHKMNVWMRKRD